MVIRFDTEEEGEFEILYWPFPLPPIKGDFLQFDHHEEGYVVIHIKNENRYFDLINSIVTVWGNIDDLQNPLKIENGDFIDQCIRYTEKMMQEELTPQDDTDE